MIPRYQTPAMAESWSDVARFRRWLEIEIQVVEALAAAGEVPADHAATCRSSAPVVDEAFVAAVLEREAVTDHDVAAFVDVVQARIGAPAGSWIHYGLTSSDVVDTALAWTMRDALDVILADVDRLIATTVALARAHRSTAMIGRTHGMHAEPTTFGAKVALWALQLGRDRERLGAARERVAVMKLSGAVGTYSNIDPAVEARVGAALGLEPVPATQVIARDRHGEFLWACASLASTIEAVALELRHLQRTEVGEVREAFRPGQKGSSAMPHKRNPISAENLTGLARVVKADLAAGLNDIALWHERDISHSSVERIILPDASTLAHYMTLRLDRVLGALEVDVDRMADNLAASRGLYVSQTVLLALVEAGSTRDDAYRVVQAAAMRAIENGIDLRTSLADDPAVPEAVARRFDELFSLERLLRHAGRAVDALDDLV